MWSKTDYRSGLDSGFLILFVFSRKISQHRFLKSKIVANFWLRKQTCGKSWRWSCCYPDVWNSLPTALRNIDSYPAFRLALKSHLFSCTFSSYCYHPIYLLILMHSRQCFCRLGHWALEHFIALYLIFHVYSFKSEQKEKTYSWNVFTPILNYLQTSQTKTIHLGQSLLFLMIMCFSEIDLRTEHVLIAVENRSWFSDLEMTVISQGTHLKY